MPKHDLPYALETVKFPDTLSAESTIYGLTRGYGVTVGNGIQGWATGAIFLHMDGSTGTTVRYINRGSNTAAEWVEETSEYARWEQVCRESFAYDDFKPPIYTYTTVANSNGVNGVPYIDTSWGWGSIHLPTIDPSDDAAVNGLTNDYCYYHTQGPVVDRGVGEFRFAVRVRVPEADTNKASWCVGAAGSTDIGATFLADTTGALPASWNGFMFHKPTGGMELFFEASTAGTQLTQSLGTVVTNTWYELEVVTTNGGNTYTPYVDGVAGTGAANVAAVNSWFLAGIKAGSDAKRENMEVDYWKAWQTPTNGSR